MRHSYQVMITQRDHRVRAHPLETLAAADKGNHLLAAGNFMLRTVHSRG